MSGERSGPNAAFHTLALLGSESYSGLESDTDRGVAVFLCPSRKKRCNLKRALAIYYKIVHNLLFAITFPIHRPGLLSI